MIRKKIVAHYKWVNLEKDITDEKSTRTVRIFGIKMWERTFECTHELPEGKKGEIGFSK